MSCFIGWFSSLPGVRCDRFDRLDGGGGVTRADQYFLSHCHTDHMQGFQILAGELKKKARHAKINNRVYCSEISKAFITNKYKIPDKAIVVLKPNDPKIVHVYDYETELMYKLRVTAIGANHCPGSVMFLFERIDDVDEGNITKRILYTGDFRFESDVSLQGLHALHDGLGQPLVIDEMYLDTTFCSEQYVSFPTRQEAEKKIWQQCQKWVMRNGMFKSTRPKHVVLLQLPAQYGYERILQHIYRESRCKWKIHVNLDKLNDYMCKKELVECTSAVSTEAEWIHACTTQNNKKEKQNKPLLKSLPCTSEEFEICQIRPSAMYFTKKKMDCLSSAGCDAAMSVTQGGANYRVCYSCHSSLTELKTFVQHFVPKKITPCAIPSGSNKEKVKEILSSFLEDADESSGCLSPNPSPTSQPFKEFSPRSTNRDAPWSDDSLAWINPSPEKSQNIESQMEDPNPSTETRVSFDDTMDVDVSISRDDESSDEEKETKSRIVWRPDPGAPCSWSNIEIIPGILTQDSAGLGSSEPPSCTITPTSANQDETMVTRRKNFARAKTDKAYCSMPLHQTPEMVVPERRRFSMPCNMKLPLIKVTPSSPSPDPNDPDYPEFFQDRLYLEHVSLKLDECSPTINEDEVNDQRKADNLSERLIQEDTHKFEQPELPVFKGTPRRIKRQQSMFCDDLDIFPSPPKRHRPSDISDDDIFCPPKCPPFPTNQSPPFPTIDQSESSLHQNKGGDVTSDVNVGGRDVIVGGRDVNVGGRQRKRADLTSDLYKAEMERRQKKRPASDSDVETEEKECGIKRRKESAKDNDIREEPQSNVKREDLKTNEEPKKYKILDEDEDMFATSSPEPDLICPFETQTMDEDIPLEPEEPARTRTPDIDELIQDAEDKNLPEHVKQRLRKVAECQKNVIQID